MNKLSPLSYAATAALVVMTGTVTSCKDFDFDEVRGDKAREELKEEYNQAFIEVFGYYGTLDIDYSHNWGFNDMPTRDQLSRHQAPTRGTADAYGYYKLQDGLDKLPAEYRDNVPSSITEDERRYVLNYLKNNPNEGSTEFGYSDYFMQNIGSGRDSYSVTDRNGATQNINSVNHMDYFCINDQHINDYNANYGPDALITGLPFSTASFHDSFSGNSFNDSWRLYYISGYGYYLCFDYKTDKGQDGKFDGDGVYNDWVLKIIPANGDKGDESCMRIFAEDLGLVGDFDFNDVVFDVDYLGNGRAKITVQAVGGTMPLYVAGHEVHELFGVDVKKMINTGASNGEGTTLTARSFEVSGLTSTNPIDIPIVVDKDGLSYSIDASQGQAPGKICVPTSTAWTRERINIKEAYTEFTRWIEDQTFKFWNGKKTKGNLYFLTPEKEG